MSLEWLRIEFGRERLRSLFRGRSSMGLRLRLRLRLCFLLVRSRRLTGGLILRDRLRLPLGLLLGLLLYLGGVLLLGGLLL